MPFKSLSQRRFMYSQHPDIAKEFEAETPKGKQLPQHVSLGNRKMAMRPKKHVKKKGYA